MPYNSSNFFFHLQHGWFAELCKYFFFGNEYLFFTEFLQQIFSCVCLFSLLLNASLFSITSSLHSASLLIYSGNFPHLWLFWFTSAIVCQSFIHCSFKFCCFLFFKRIIPFGSSWFGILLPPPLISLMWVCLSNFIHLERFVHFDFKIALELSSSTLTKNDLHSLLQEDIQMVILTFFLKCFKLKLPDNLRFLSL